VVLLKEWNESQKGVAVFGKIKCPRNYVLKEGHQPYKLKLNPLTKHLNQKQIDYYNARFNLRMRRWLSVKDRHGNKVQDFNSYYQPSVSKAYVIEHIYDPKNPICKYQCRGRCLRELGFSANTNTIKRLK